MISQPSLFVRPQAVHANSREAFRTIDLGARERMVLWAIASKGSATDREVCGLLDAPDMNYVRPRITELVKAGKLEECGKVRDSVTGRMVRIVRVKK